jgi:hypothetical protein
MPPKGYKQSDETKAKISKARSIPQAKCVCLNCGINFETHQTELRRGGGKFCSRKCHDDYRVGKPIPQEVCDKRSAKLKGRIITPEWRAKISAAMKGKPNWRKGIPVSEEQKEKQSEKMTGRKHTPEHNYKIRCNTPRGKDSPHYVEGKSYGQYCPKFNAEFRERVRAFFGHKCIECGNPQNGEKHSVHHILYNKKACCDDTIPMFAPLCRSCHAKTNFKRKVWQNHFADIIQNNYGGKSFLTKEEFKDYLCG